MEDFEFEDKCNPWTDGVSSLEDFRQMLYCCPQCDVKERSKSDFIKHALDTHPKSKALIDIVDCATSTKESRKRSNEEQQPIFAPKTIKLEPLERGTDQSSINVTKNIQSSSDNVQKPIPSASGLQKKNQTSKNKSHSAIKRSDDSLKDISNSWSIVKTKNGQSSQPQPMTSSSNVAQFTRVVHSVPQ